LFNADAMGRLQTSAMYLRHVSGPFFARFGAVSNGIIQDGWRPGMRMWNGATDPEANRLIQADAGSPLVSLTALYKTSPAPALRATRQCRHHRRGFDNLQCPIHFQTIAAVEFSPCVCHDCDGMPGRE